MLRMFRSVVNQLGRVAAGAPWRAEKLMVMGSDSGGGWERVGVLGECRRPSSYLMLELGNLLAVSHYVSSAAEDISRHGHGHGRGRGRGLAWT
jgi:hypothetical protein